MSQPPASLALGLWSGVGLCVSSMVGAGVFLSAGYMAQSMSAAAILGAWAVGALLAMAGARAYAEVAQLIPRSGGEYRYLSELLHPAAGYVAGVVTVVIGFAQPTAINALAASSFMGTIFPDMAGKWTAGGLVVLLGLVHGIGMHGSKLSQNVLAVAKVALLGGFVLLGLLAGSHEMPSWSPPKPEPGWTGPPSSAVCSSSATHSAAGIPPPMPPRSSSIRAGTWRAR